MFEKKKKHLIYFILLVGTFLLLFVPSGLFTSFKFRIVDGTSLPIRIISFPFREFKKILFYHRTFNEFKRLRREVSTLQGRLIGFDEVLRENTRLERLLDFKRKLLFSSVAANVVGRDPSNWNATIIIDKGEQDGVTLGMPVVNALGVVGKIAEVSAHKAKVVLLTDPSFSVVALDQRSREIGLASGTLQGLCRLRYLSSDADIQEGDQIITAKLSSSFPEGLLIGKVITVYPAEDDPVIDCVVQPAVSFSQIEEVLVIQKE